MEKKEDIVDVQALPVGAGFNWSVGFIMEKFIKTLANKELLAVKCPVCKYTYVPPRSRCGKCNAKIEDKDLITLSGKGKILGYTTAHVRLDGSGNFLNLKEPRIIGAIKLEDADSTIFMPVEGIKPEEIKEGMEVEVKWAEETKGKLTDIQCFKPA